MVEEHSVAIYFSHFRQDHPRAKIQCHLPYTDGFQNLPHDGMVDTGPAHLIHTAEKRPPQGLQVGEIHISERLCSHNMTTIHGARGPTSTNMTSFTTIFAPQEGGVTSVRHKAVEFHCTCLTDDQHITGGAQAKFVPAFQSDTVPMSTARDVCRWSWWLPIASRAGSR